MINRIKNIFFILPFIMHTVFAFDSYSGDELFGLDLGLSIELSEVADYSSSSSNSSLSLAPYERFGFGLLIKQDEDNSAEFFYSAGERFAEPLQEEQDVTIDFIEDQIFLSFLNDFGAQGLDVAQSVCGELAYQQGSDDSQHSSSSSSYTISDSSSSSFSSSSSNDESGNTIERFIAAVNQLPRIEREGQFHKCPIPECAYLAKKKDNLEIHLKRHNAALAVCIFCKKELHSQDKADSHHCKCPVCAAKCVKNANAIEYMTKHVRKQHYQLAKELDIAQINEELGDRGFASSSDNSSSSLIIQAESVGSKITYTCAPCDYSTDRKSGMSNHVYKFHFDADGIECPLCYKKIYTFDKDHLCMNYRKKLLEPQFTEAYLAAYPQFAEPICQELPELRSVKKGTRTHYTCPYCDRWCHKSIPELSYHIYCCHTLARKETCHACVKPMYMKGDLAKHAGRCPVKDSASNSSSSSSSSLLALTSALSASNSKRGRPSSSNVRKDAEAEPKRLCTPSSLQPASPERWSPLEFPFSEEQGDQFGDDSSKSLG